MKYSFVQFAVAAPIFVLFFSGCQRSDPLANPPPPTAAAPNAAMEVSDMAQITLKELSAHPAVLKDWADYQSGSIVSRKIIQQPAGTVTHFAFDAGQALSEHTAPFNALVQIIDGEAEVTIAGLPLTVKTGEMVLLPANKPHAVKANQRFKMLLTMIHS